MQDLAQQYGITDPRVIRKSQMLDKLIVQYMTSLPCKKSKVQTDMPTEELHRRLESLNRLRENIEVLEQS
ncbi:aspartyl-phosphate phosphatase Spo0E family protein [Cohnella luojiensis]